MENLALRRCNKLPTATYVLCHSEIETVDHIFLSCNFTRRIWEHFIRIFRLPDPSRLISSLWDSWRALVQPSLRDLCDLVVKALVWNVRRARNDIIFNNNVVPVQVIILNIDHMLLSWFSNCTDSLKGKLEVPMKSISRSLESFGKWPEGGQDVTVAEEAISPMV